MACERGVIFGWVEGEGSGVGCIMPTREGLETRTEDADRRGGEGAGFKPPGMYCAGGRRLKVCSEFLTNRSRSRGWVGGPGRRGSETKHRQRKGGGEGGPN
jgi:hypothetical protein